MKLPLSIVFLVLAIDQAIKFYIKTHFFLGEEHRVAGHWFMLHFTENNGMAFGMEFAGRFGKLFLSIFRIGAVAGIAWYLYSLVQRKAPIGLLISISLILAGALGNILDSCFYGLLFTDSQEGMSHLSLHGDGYAGFLHGRVVDMFYFPIIEGHFPGWFPLWGTEEFVFFRPVFNFSDSAISVGVFMILLFQRNFFAQHQVVSNEQPPIKGGERAVPESEKGQ